MWTEWDGIKLWNGSRYWMQLCIGLHQNCFIICRTDANAQIHGTFEEAQAKLKELQENEWDEKSVTT